MNVAKVFWSGRSQAIRLPKEFRFDTAEVSIKRRGNAVIIEPIPESWNWLDALVGDMDEDFERAARETPPPQERPDLSIFD